MSLVSSYARNAFSRRVSGLREVPVRVLRGSLGTLDTVTGTVGGLGSSTRIYSGVARVHRVTGTDVASIGGGEIAQRVTRISIPMDTVQVPRRDDLVQVLSDDVDSDLNTRIFRVLDVDGGALLGGYRSLTCQGWYESRYWAPS